MSYGTPQAKDKPRGLAVLTHKLRPTGVLAQAGQFLESCSPEIVDLYSRIWTDVQK